MSDMSEQKSGETAETILLFGVQDATGRVYLTDAQECLPPNARDVQVFRVARERVEWSILSVQLLEWQRIPVTIHIGSFIHTSTPHSAAR